jgi:hypothetical protein
MFQASNIPFQNFVSVVAVVASLGVSFSLTASISCITATSFRGVNDANVQSTLQGLTVNFSWSTAFFALSLILSVGLQLIMSSPAIQRALLSKSGTGMFDPPLSGEAVSTSSPSGGGGGLTYNLVRLLAWIDLGFVIAAIVFMAQAVKVFADVQGKTIEWGLLGIGLSTMFLWLCGGGSF